MCRVVATYNNTRNIQTKIFIVIHRGWSKSPCRFHFFNRIHRNLNFQTFMNVHVYINNSQSVILSSLKISWPILHHCLSPLSTLQSAKRSPFELHEPLWWTSLYFSSDFLFLSESQRICVHFVSLYARIRGCRKNRGLIEAKERGSTISGREMQIENLRPPYARVHRQENWGCARIIRIARGMLRYNVLYPTTDMGELFFFHPTSSKYVDYIWWSSRRLRFNSRQLRRNIQTYLLLFDRILDTKLWIN